MSDSLGPHELQHARLPCPSVSPGVCSNSCPLSRLCHFILCRPLLLLPCLSQQQGQFSSVQSLSRLRLCDPMNHSTPGLPVHHQLPEFTQLTSIESVTPYSHLILCHPLLPLPTIPPSIRVFSNESTLHMR